MRAICIIKGGGHYTAGLVKQPTHSQDVMFVTHERNSHPLYEQFASFDKGSFYHGHGKKTPHTIKTSFVLPMIEIHIIYASNLYKKKGGGHYNTGVVRKPQHCQDIMFVTHDRNSHSSYDQFASFDRGVILPRAW